MLPRGIGNIIKWIPGIHCAGRQHGNRCALGTRPGFDRLLNELEFGSVKAEPVRVDVPCITHVPKDWMPSDVRQVNAQLMSPASTGPKPNDRNFLAMKWAREPVPPSAHNPRFGHCWPGLICGRCGITRNWGRRQS